MKQYHVNNEWTLLGEDVTSFSFQNIGQYVVMVAFSKDKDTPPEGTHGFAYDVYEKEVKKDLSGMSFLDNASAVWARTMSGKGASVIFDKE